ncbi:glycosyl transferases group 1 [Trichococcus palustris]|uniref:Glycosyl transferases group 1 n=1 Tax=Trichococcus palustris TaxID=140314 RepID=A0A143YR78_9LACT|nr:glycosyltransferase family 4 protein [Trichococcus palustris]CZQ96571.1 glycosyl transferases group 1 [Trichococcus palustris]SFK73912.1 Glycosyltransferase involved in cell wall bisynthesis [Trichococcus palustris]
MSGNSKRICFCSGAISRSGGTERVGTIIANELCQRGYEVYILSFWDHGKSYFEIDKRIEISYLLKPREGKLYRTYIYPIVKLHNFIKKKKIDVFIDIDTTLTAYSAHAVKGTRCKLISWEHFNYWTMMEDRKRIKAKLLAKKYADKIVVLTKTDLQKHTDSMNISKDKICNIYNPSPFKFNSNYNYNSKQFISVGRLTHQKGYDLLLEAWSIFEKENKQWHLNLVGNGEDEIKLKEKCKELSLQNFIFVGETKNVKEYYQNSSCYLLSSRYEGFPMVILEAQSFGLPVIAFNCKTGPAEMIENEVNGYLVEELNVNELARKMIDFAEQRERAERMSIEATKSVANLSIEKIGVQWEDLIESLFE